MAGVTAAVTVLEDTVEEVVGTEDIFWGAGEEAAAGLMVGIEAGRAGGWVAKEMVATEEAVV